MKPELQLYLKNKFPKLYTEHTVECPFTQRGFECDDGWFRLVLWLSRYLQSYIDKQNEWTKLYPDTYLPVTQIHVEQVKEKFGTLRFYKYGGNEHTNSIISFAEYISGFICETTGKTDNIGYSKKGYIKTSHQSLGRRNDFNPIDDSELLEILSGQKEFSLDIDKKD